MTRLFLSNTEYKIRNSLFIHQVDLFVCTSYVYHAWKKESQNVPLKLLVSIVNQKIFIMIQYTSSVHQNIYDSFEERMEILPRNQIIWIFEAPDSTYWNQIYHTTQKQLAQSLMKSSTLISKQPPRITILKIKHSTKD